MDHNHQAKFPSQHGSMTEYLKMIESVPKGSSYVLFLLKNDFPIITRIYEICLSYYQNFSFNKGFRFLGEYNSILKQICICVQKQITKMDIGPTNGKYLLKFCDEAKTKDLIIYINEISKSIDIMLIPEIDINFRYFDSLIHCIYEKTGNYLVKIIRKKIENRDCGTFSFLISSMVSFAHDFPYLDYNILFCIINKNIVVSYESLIHLNALQINHDFVLKTQYCFEGYSSPVIDYYYDPISKLLSFKVEQLNDDGSYTIEPIKYLFKNEGACEGFIFKLKNAWIFVKELLYDSAAYNQIKNEIIGIYIKSLKSKSEDAKLLVSSTQNNIHTKSNNMDNNFKNANMSNYYYYTNELQYNIARRVLDNYINPYAEMLSYVLLYYIGYMPPLNIIKSAFFKKIYLMVDNYPLEDKEFSSKYVEAQYFKIESADFESKNLNNLASCIHTFRIFNYLFMLGDFHDRNYAICRSNDDLSKEERKYKIIIFDLWMNPYQIHYMDLLEFKEAPKYSLFYYDLSSDIYSNLYNDFQTHDESIGSMLSRLMNSTNGANRLPFITIKSLKKIFKNIFNNLEIIFKCDDHEQQLYSNYIQYLTHKNDNGITLSCYLLFKLYDVSKETLLSNEDLIEEYMKYNKTQNEIKTQKFLIKQSQSRLMKLYESLIKINNIPMIFIRKPMSFHCRGSIELIEEFNSFRSSDEIDISKQFTKNIINPENIQWIFIFFTLKVNDPFFNQTRLSSIETNLLSCFNISDADNCIFVVYRKVVELDLYITYIVKNYQFVIHGYAPVIFDDSLLFILSNSKSS